jgi:hypothetical protein
MKKKGHLSVIINLFFIIIFLGLTPAVKGQDTTKVSPPLPDDINKIVSASCMPCHSAKGGMMSRSKLNFNDWTSYPAEKQKEKANDIYKEVSNDKMPPKNARENNPGIIPTKEQVSTIKKWVDSFGG